ncbi:MAG TPA: Wzz/FepE/Etk N-terminal domain-containing protein, partial [Cytophagales bacterium]|nr:Wzz/FepE/Etk N-terminal domain-containing protein [Cytophagales bacterium]
MEKRETLLSKAPLQDDDDESLLDSLDFIKFLLVAQRNLIWVLLIFAICFFAAFVYARYTKSIYESSSVIKIEKKEETSIALQMNTVDDNASKILSSEIEILKSRTFFEKLAKKLGFKVTVFAYGSINYEERYKNSPFVIDYVIMDRRYYDHPFNIEVADENSFYFFPTSNPEQK